MDRVNSHIIAVYPGSFDPVTLGHIDIIKRASKLFDKVIVAVAASLHKKTLFSLEERIEFIRESVRDFPNVEVKPLINKLLVDFCKEHKANAIIRGLRAVSDFEYEFKMAWMNRRLYPDVEILFLIPSEEYAYLASSLVKEIASLGGDISSLVPKPVANRLREMRERIKKEGTGEEFEQSI